MRRQHFWWTYLTTAIVLTLYGCFSLVYNSIKGKGLSILGIVFTSLGGVMLLLFLILWIISYFQKKNRKEEPVNLDDAKPAPMPKIIPVENKPEENHEVKLNKETSYVRPVNRSRYDRDDNYSTVYISKVGSGVLMRIEGNRIYDMRNNSYYTIEENMVKLNGSGPVFEISGNRIRAAFGSYLYEISGGNVNKIYGGYYASISGNSLQVHDLSVRYEFSGSLNLKQQLAVVALLFGKY